MAKPAQYGTVQGSVDTVNDAIAQGKTATLIRGDLIDVASCSHHLPVNDCNWGPGLIPTWMKMLDRARINRLALAAYRARTKPETLKDLTDQGQTRRC